MGQPEVSVVIPAYNEATYIDRLLKALAKQKTVNYEVIISDANSKDGTKEVAESFKDRFKLKFVEYPPNNPAFGRNQGAKQADAEWLLFLDADIDLPDIFFIRKLIDGTKRNHWFTSSGQLKVGPGSWLGKIGHSQAYMNLMAHTKHPIMQGYCILTKRLIFEANQGFNENIQYGEDNDYCNRIAKYGFGFVKDARYIVDPRRYEQEGVRLLYKNICHEIYRLTHEFNFKDNKTAYEFGKHKKRGN